MQYKYTDTKETKDKHKTKDCQSSQVEISFHTEDESSNFLDTEPQEYARAPRICQSPGAQEIWKWVSSLNGMKRERD